MLGTYKSNIFSVLRSLFIAISVMFLSVSTVFAEDITPSSPTGVASKEQAAAVTDIVLETPRINTTLIAEIDSSIIVNLDGETLSNTDVRRAEDGQIYVNAVPIFNQLNNSVEFDSQTNALIVKRSQDGVVMELFTDTGIVKADGRALGRLKHFGEVSDNGYYLTPNTISVLSGTKAKFDSENNELAFTLDPRLRVATGFDIYVNDFPLRDLSVQAKSVGPVLLLPIRPIAEELGHTLTLLEGGSVLRVKRAQDSAVLSLNLDTGLIKLRDAPFGIAKDVSYIDPINLLLPVSALEALTGTHVKVEGGSSRIDINLDDRLSGAVEPGERVDDLAKGTKFTPESLSFHLSPDSLNTVTLDSHAGAYNGRLRYEIPDLPTTGAELEPAWLSFDFAHLNGTRGSVGDYATDLRELDGLGLQRIRGVAAHKVTEKGRWAVAAGAPMRGSKRISDDQSRQTFGGFAGGVRYADRDGWEAGAAFAKDNLTDDQKLVLSAISGNLGRTNNKKIQWDAQADAGYFSGPTREKSIDLRIGGRTQYEMSDDLRLDANIQYDGVEFTRTTLALEEQDDLTEIEREAQNNRIEQIKSEGLDFVNLGIGARYSPDIRTGLIRNPSAVLNVEMAKTGVTQSGMQESRTHQISMGLGAAIGDRGININASGRIFDTNVKNDRSLDVSGQQLSISSFARIKGVTVRGQYEYGKLKGEEANNRLALTANLQSYEVPLPKNATLSGAPSVSALWSDQSGTSVRGGLTAGFQSGDLFGEENRVTASLGILQSISSNQGSQSDQFFSLSYGRKVRLGKNMSLGLAYRNNLKGDHRVGLVLDGRFDFNEKRRYTQTKDGMGVLKGQVFLDENRDNIRQPEERGLPGIPVKIKETRLALRTDANGFYTIQNIKAGLYEVQIDARSLPLGFDLSTQAKSRVTIADGQISSVALPIHQRGQITGFAYIDDNKDGEFTRGEERIEGATLVLKNKNENESRTTYTSTFGQYAFDDLPPGTYTVSVKPNPKALIEGGQSYELDISDLPNLMGRRNIAVIKKKRVLSVEGKEPEPMPPDESFTSVQTQGGVAPP